MGGGREGFEKATVTHYTPVSIPDRRDKPLPLPSIGKLYGVERLTNYGLMSYSLRPVCLTRRGYRYSHR
jgi:hypothetical protein